MQPYGRVGGPQPAGYMQPQVARMQPQMGRGPQPVAWRPGMPVPATGVQPGYMGGMQAPGVHRYPPAQIPASRPSKGPPKREMDSLLEEIKAKQRLQEQKKEILKTAEARAAAAEAAGPGADGPSLPAGAGTAAAGDPRAAAAAAALSGGLSPSGGGAAVGAAAAQANTQTEGAGAEIVQPNTRLFLRELPTSINEETVCNLFSRYGVVTTVDIVRANEQGERTRGYVTLDTRDNAERAKEALQDREVDGVPLWIEWAKGPVTQEGSRQVFVEPPVDKLKRRIIDRLAKYVAQEGHPFEQIVMERETQGGMFAFLFQPGSPDNIYYRWRTYAFAQGDNFRVWRSELFQICEGGAWWRPPPCDTDSDKRRSTNFSSAPPPPVRPAPLPATPATTAKPVPRPAGGLQVGVPSSWTQADIVEERERQRLEEKATQERQKRDRDRKGLAGGKRLSDADWDRMEQLLRGVTGARSLVLEAMVFCLDKSDWAIEITECITESLTIVETDIALKLARLLIVSDILHNTASSKPSAWAYRREFERSLPDIFEHMHISLARQESRLAADKAREQVIRLLRVWEDWGLFAPQYVRGLEAALVVGVRSLRALAAKGDASREPAWLEPKLADWRRQHFSQLEKMCRTRGLRCSTSHLESTKALSLEEARKEWLIDRLATYELHWHEKEQARVAAAGSAPAVSSSRAPSSKSTDDLDGEAIECDLDGFPLDETELDGEPLDVSDMGDLLRAIEASRQPLDNCLGGLSGGVDGSNGGLGSVALGGALLSQSSPASGELLSSASDEVVGVVCSGTVETTGSPTEPSASTVEGASAPPQQAEQRPQDEDTLDIERPEDPAALEVSADDDVETRCLVGGAGSRIDHEVLRSIELEVMELRASLETQGLHRDAIDDICGEKRQRLIEEHEATLASPMRRDSEAEDVPLASPENEEPKARSEEPERAKDKAKAQPQAGSRSRDGDRAASRPSAEQKARAKSKERAKKEKGKEQSKGRSPARAKKERAKPRAAASAGGDGRGRSKSKERSKKDKARERSRSRSRERGKKARR